MCLLLKSCFAGGVKRQSEHLPCCANVWYPLLLEILWRFLPVLSVFFLMRSSAARRYQAMQSCRAISLKQGNNFHLSELQRAEGSIHCFHANCCADRSPLMLRDALLLYPLCRGACASFPSCTPIPHTGKWKGLAWGIYWLGLNGKGKITHAEPEKGCAIRHPHLENGKNYKMQESMGWDVHSRKCMRDIESQCPLTWLRFFILISHRIWQPFLIPQSLCILLTTCFAF